MKIAEIFNARPYQRYAIRRMIDSPAISLMLDMGMGKTVSTLTAIQELMYDRFEVQKVLVIAPLHVAETTWLEENEKWQHLNLKIVPVLGSLKKRLAALSQSSDVYVINRENVVWLIEHYRTKFPFDMIVIDESGSFKNPHSKRFRALRKIRPLVKRIVELTGTPAANGLMDLWSQIYLLDRGERLGKTLGEYRGKYFKPAASNGFIVYSWALRENADKQIYKKISDICVSMKSEDYLTLPPVINNVVKIQLPNSVKNLYRKFKNSLVLEIKDTPISAANAAVLTNKLLQFANGAIYDDSGTVNEIHHAKLDALEDIFDTCGQSVLVFYWFNHDLDRLQERFKSAVVLKTSDNIKDWNAGKIKMLLAHPMSAGHGLNLQFGGSLIVWFGLIWSLELYLQANKRLHRTGQKNSVVINHLVAEGTIDEVVMKVLAAKNSRQENLLNAVKAIIQNS